MIVREDADVDRGGGKASDVCRMHPVVDALGPALVAASHAGLEVHDARVGRDVLQLCQSISPDVRQIDRPWDGTVHFLGELDVRAGVRDHRFVDPGIVRMWQDLIDASSGHDVAAEEDGGESLSVRIHAGFLSKGSYLNWALQRVGSMPLHEFLKVRPRLSLPRESGHAWRLRPTPRYQYPDSIGDPHQRVG